MDMEIWEGEECTCNSCRVERFCMANGISSPHTYFSFNGKTVKTENGSTGMVVRTFSNKVPYTVEICFEDKSNEFHCVLDVQLVEGL